MGCYDPTPIEEALTIVDGAVHEILNTPHAMCLGFALLEEAAVKLAEGDGRGAALHLSMIAQHDVPDRIYRLAKNAHFILSKDGVQ